MFSRFPYLLLLAALFLSVFATSLLADADKRNWTNQETGEEFPGSLVDVDDAGGTVRLRLDSGDVVTYKTSLFSAIDRAWLASWAEANAELDEIVKNTKGTLTRHQAQGEFTTEYYVYEPSDAGPPEQRPVLLLFNPGGKAQQYIKRFIEPAEETKMMVITLGHFHNTNLDDPLVDVKEASMSRRFGEVWLDIQQKVEFDMARVFMGGTSNGARRAFNYTWQYPRAWAGIWNNGGVIDHKKPPAHDFADNMRVVIVIGNQDSNNHWVPQDTRALKKHNAKIGIISFEGGHQMPPKDKIVQSFNWLLGDEETFTED